MDTFGPIWKLFDKAREVNPFFGYTVPALLLVVTFVFIIQWLEKVSILQGLDPIRTTLLVVYTMVTLLAFLATISGVFVEDLDRKMLIHTLVRLVFLTLLVAFGALIAYLASDDSHKLCKFHKAIVGEGAVCTPQPVPDPPIVSGVISVGKLNQYINPEDFAVMILAENRFETTADRLGNFSTELPLSKIGKTAIAEVVFRNQKESSEPKTISKAGAHVGHIEFPNVSVSAASTDVQIRKTEDSLPIFEGNRILPIETKKANFDGLGWKYDIFYCRLPVGDELQSEKLARQLKNVIQAQSGIESVNIKVWPTNKSGYQLSDGELQINTPIDSSKKEAQADRIAKLLQPFLDDGEMAAIRPVTSNFSNYLSLVACRQAS